jgi:hypothetical protein
MLFITSLFSFILIVIACMYDDLVIDFLAKTAGAPMVGFGAIAVANKQTNRVISYTYFEGIWDYLVTWCNAIHKYEDEDVIIELFPGDAMPPCTYDETRMHIVSRVYKYQILDWIAIALSALDLIIMMIIDIYVYHVRFTNIFKKNIYWISILLQISALILILTDIMYVMPQILDTYWGLDHMPLKQDLLNPYVCLLFFLTILNGVINTLHKVIYVNMMRKELNDEQIRLDSEQAEYISS